MAFPTTSDLFPLTEADDGDRSTSCVMDEPAFPGCSQCRPIALSRANRGQEEVRNDRIIAVEKDAHSWADIKTIAI